MNTLKYKYFPRGPSINDVSSEGEGGEVKNVGIYLVKLFIPNVKLNFNAILDLSKVFNATELLIYFPYWSFLGSFANQVLICFKFLDL